MDYLKDKQEYIDFYDLLTIEECLQWIELAKESGRKIQEIQKPEKLGYAGALAEVALYFKKGENYRNKEKTINEWMVRDKKLQEKYDNTPEPENIFCDECNYGMKLFDKTLNQKSEDKPRMLFFFECPHCRKRKGIYEDGEIFETNKNVLNVGLF
jgi:DNA-directed RNA polymerase subunit M/transcription elongation factor TFIIS